MANSAWLRKTASVVVAATLLMTSAALPMMDLDMFQNGPRIEAEHSALGCAYVHNHVVCVQLAGSRWIAQTPTSGLAGARVLSYQDMVPPRLAPVLIPSLRPFSRAPPSA